MISIILSVILGCICFILISLIGYAAYQQGVKDGIKSVPQEPQRMPQELSEEEKRKREQIKRETENFYAYTGDKQE